MTHHIRRLIAGSFPEIVQQSLIAAISLDEFVVLAKSPRLAITGISNISVSSPKFSHMLQVLSEGSVRSATPSGFEDLLWILRLHFGVGLGKMEQLSLGTAL